MFLKICESLPAELKVKDMTYGLLLSHTFPGLLFGLEILLSFELVTNVHILTSLFLFRKPTTSGEIHGQFCIIKTKRGRRCRQPNKR